jgi:hypothetical protein
MLHAFALTDVVDTHALDGWACIRNRHADFGVTETEGEGVGFRAGIER